MSRKYCHDCQYPIVTCVCHAIESVDLKTNIYILQHPKEKNHAKSTVRLLRLLSSKIKVINTHEQNLIEKSLNKLDKSTTAVIYPNQRSIALDANSNQKQTKCIKNLIVIDGSWSQAYSIYHNNKYLHKFVSYHFDKPPTQKFTIRKAKRAEQLSTLEAVAYSLLHIEGQNEQPFLFLFKEMQKHWHSYLA